MWEQFSRRVRETYNDFCSIYLCVHTDRQEILVNWCWKALWRHPADSQCHLLVVVCLWIMRWCCDITVILVYALYASLRDLFHKCRLYSLRSPTNNMFSDLLSSIYLLNYSNTEWDFTCMYLMIIGILKYIIHIIILVLYPSSSFLKLFIGWTRGTRAHGFSRGNGMCSWCIYKHLYSKALLAEPPIDYLILHRVTGDHMGTKEIQDLKATE